MEDDETMRPEPSDDQLIDIYNKRAERSKEVSGKLSDSTRLIGLGIVAWLFAVHTSSSEFTRKYLEVFSLFVNLAGILAVFGMILDYFHYICAYFAVEAAKDSGSKNYYAFDKKSFAYNAQFWAFRAKHGFILSGALIIAVTFAITVVMQEFGMGAG